MHCTVCQSGCIYLGLGNQVDMHCTVCQSGCSDLGLGNQVHTHKMGIYVNFLLQGKIFCQIILLIWTFIGQFVHPVGGEGMLGGNRYFVAIYFKT